MTEIEALRERLRKTKNLSGVARQCGLNLKTLYRTRDGQSQPLKTTFDKIVACLDRLDSER